MGYTGNGNTIPFISMSPRTEKHLKQLGFNFMMHNMFPPHITEHDTHIGIKT